MSRNQELRDALAELAADRREGRAHPSADELAAYHGGELPPEGQSRIQDHLAACRECAALLLDLDGLADPDFGAGSGLAEKEAVWGRLREEVRVDERGAAPLAPVVPIRRSAFSSPRWLQALAASLLVATLGLSLWVASLRRTVNEISAPEPNAVVLDLSSGTARGAGSPLPTATVPSGARSFILILTPHEQRRNQYRAVIERSSGGVVWSGGLALNQFGSLTLRLSRRELGPGDYRVRLLGEGGTRTEEYALHVESR